MHSWILNPILQRKCTNGVGGMEPLEVENNQKSPISYLLVFLFQITLWSKLCSITKWFNFNNFSISSASHQADDSWKTHCCNAATNIQHCFFLQWSHLNPSSIEDPLTTALCWQQCLSYSEVCPTPFTTVFYSLSNWYYDKWVWLHTFCSYFKVGMKTTIPYKALQWVPLGP